MNVMAPHSSYRAVDPAHLEFLGKRAAAQAEADGMSLTHHVVESIAAEKLSAEAVRRVTEFANIEAVTKKFAAVQGTHRSVHIDGGPADPTLVLQKYSALQRPKEVTVDALEYSMPPEYMAKSASFELVSDRTVPGVLGGIDALRQKLASAHDEVIQSVEASREAMVSAMAQLVEEAKLASLSGATAAELLAAWDRIDPELSKTAFSRAEAVLVPGEKVANRRIRGDAAVVTVFADFVKSAKSYGAHLTALSEIESGLSSVNSWISTHQG